MHYRAIDARHEHGAILLPHWAIRPNSHRGRNFPPQCDVLKTREMDISRPGVTAGSCHAERLVSGTDRRRVAAQRLRSRPRRQRPAGPFPSAHGATAHVDVELPATLPPASFGFVFTYGLCVPSRVDTFAGTFSRAGTVVDPAVTVPLSLLPADIQRIQRDMDQIDFFDYPSDFTLRSARGGTSVTPSNYYSFAVREGARQHTVRWQDDVLNVPSEQADQLRALANLVERTAHGAPTVAALPAPNARCA